MIRKSSKTDAHLRWLREYQRERNTAKGIYRANGACVIRAFYRMPRRFHPERFNYPMPMVDTSGIGARYWMLKLWALEYTKRELRAAHAHRNSRNWTRGKLP